MAIKQRKAPAEKPNPVIEDIPTSEDEPLEAEYHTEPSEDEEEVAAEPDNALEEYHTDPEDASDASPEIPLLPTALLKSKPSAPAAQINWESLSREEKKTLRDELGMSMRELRGEAQKNGVLDAGKMAQLKRGIRPAERVAGGRVAKKKNKRRTGAHAKTEMSGRQKLVEQRSREGRKRVRGGGEKKAVKKRKG